MTRIVFPLALMALSAACDIIDRNPCDRYADFMCDCYGSSSSECREIRQLAQNPTADVQEGCEFDLADAQRDTSECLDDGFDTGVTWWDTAW